MALNYLEQFHTFLISEVSVDGALKFQALHLTSYLYITNYVQYAKHVDKYAIKIIIYMHYF